MYCSKMSWQCLTCGFMKWLTRLVAFIDHTAKHLAVPHQRAERHDGRLIMIGWPLAPGLVRPVPVVMPGVGPQHRWQMGFALDQHSVGALGPYSARPPFGIAIRPGRTRRRPRRRPHLGDRPS